MKKLIVCRHGSYDEEGKIDPEGQRKLQSLAKEQIKPRIRGETVTMISSKAKRAVSSAEVLARELEIDRFETNEALGDEIMDNPRLALLLTQSLSDRTDVLILITHGYTALELPSLFLRVNEHFDLDYGEAVLALCDERRILKLSA